MGHVSILPLLEGEWIHVAVGLSPFASSPETITTLLISCTLIQNKKPFRKKSPMIDENRMPYYLSILLIGV